MHTMEVARCVDVRPCLVQLSMDVEAGIVDTGSVATDDLALHVDLYEVAHAHEAEVDGQAVY